MWIDYLCQLPLVMANETEDLIYVEISEMDYLLICFVRALRTQKGLTQLQLSQRMRLADGFVSKVETFVERAKYSIRHLPLLAIALECEIKDVLPKQTPKYDQIRLTLRRTNKINKDGSISSKKITDVVNIEPIAKKVN